LERRLSGFRDAGGWRAGRKIGPGFVDRLSDNRPEIGPLLSGKSRSRGVRAARGTIAAAADAKYLFSFVIFLEASTNGPSSWHYSRNFRRMYVMNSPSVLEPAAPQGSVLISGVGASHGLGAAIARRFAAGGYPVAIAGRNAEKLGATAAEIAATGAKVSHVVGDASKPTDVARFVKAAQQLAP
jgi:short chain dehydrogenase